MLRVPESVLMAHKLVSLNEESLRQETWLKKQSYHRCHNVGSLEAAPNSSST